MTELTFRPHVYCSVQWSRWLFGVIVNQVGRGGLCSLFVGPVEVRLVWPGVRRVPDRS